jgi:WD40 repeat protein
VAFSPDGKKLASGGHFRMAHLWDMSNGKELKRFKEHRNYVYTVAFSPDGNRLLSAGGDSANGQVLPPDCSIRLWDVMTGKEVRRFEGHTKSVRSVAFSPDGRQALSGSDDQTLRLWEVKTGKEIRQFKGHSSTIWSVAFSPDGRHVLSGSGAIDGVEKRAIDCAARFWEVKTGKEIAQFKCFNRVRGVAFSADGRRALTASDYRIRLWDVTAKKELSHIEPIGGCCQGVAFAPDGSQAACAGWPVQVWKVTEAALNTRLAHPEKVLAYSVAFDPQGKWLATANRAGGARGHLWKLGGKQPEMISSLGSPAGWGVAVPFTPNGKIIAWISSDEGRLWDLTADRPRKRAVLPEQSGYGAVFSPDNQMLATGGKDNAVVLWDLTWGVPKEQHRLTGHTGLIQRLVITPDGKRLASASQDHTIRLWELGESGPKNGPVLTGSPSTVQALAFSPDGKTLVSGSGDGRLRLWDLSGTEPREQAVLKARSSVHALAVAPDGQSFYSADFSGRIVHWISALKQKVWQLPGPVSDLALSCDGRYLATANGNGTVYILRLEGSGIYKAWLKKRHRAVAVDPALKTINGKPAAEVLKKADGK